MPELIIPCSGGLDLQSDPTQCAPGTLRNCLNFEQSQSYGYTQCKGWSRYDGSITVEELLDFYFFVYSSVTGTPVFGERVDIVMIPASASTPVTLSAIFIGRNTISHVICFAYTNVSPQSFINVQGAEIVSVSFIQSGATASAAAQIIYQLCVYDSTSPLVGSGYGGMFNIVQSQHSSVVQRVLGNSNSPVDACFILNDVTYAVHDCTVINFSSGTSLSGVTPLEGHIMKVGSGVLGTILSITVTSGDWGASTAAGYIVYYDEGLVPLGPVDGSSLNLYTANGVTNLGTFATFVLAGSYMVQPTTTRSLLYKTQDQSVGNISAWPGWQRIQLSRELPYTQAYAGQTSGIGFGPATAATPFSIYEYSRQGLTTAANQLSPLTTNTPGCTTATAIGTWTNINNIKANDGAFAVSPNFPSHSQFVGLKAQGFAFTDANGNALPPNTAITGITVTIQIKASVGSALQDFQICLIKPDGTTLVPGPNSTGKANSFPLTTVSTLYSYGGANDLWGSSFTLADVLSANFGVAAKWQNLGVTTTNNVSVDFVGVTVTYLPPTRAVYVRNSQATAPSDVACMIVHYTTDNNSNFFSGNATGTLTIYSLGTEASLTAAGKSRVIGVGEQIRDAPAGGGNLLGWTSGTDYPVSYPAGAALDAALARWEWITYNFYSDPTAQMAFGANGVEYASGFDGTYTVRIRTGRRVDLDNPRHLFGYYGTLHIGYNSGDVLTSGAGPRPLTVAAAVLSQAYNVGQPVVGFANLQGQTLAVFCPRKVGGLQGTDPTNYSQVTLSPALGAFEYTVADVEGQVVWTSFRGVETMQTTNAYGNFDTVPLSTKATPLLQLRLQADARLAIRNQSPSYAVGIRNNRQYRLYFKDGYTFSMTLFGADSIPCPTMGFNYLANLGPSLTPAVARHLFQGVRSDGKEIIYACWDASNTAFGPFPYSYVARLEQGYTQDNQSSVCGIEFNPVYPYVQNENLSPITECQFQYVAIYASAVLPYKSTDGALVYSQADDLPIFRNNPLPYTTTAGPGYPYDNYINYPNPGAGQRVPISGNLYTAAVFMPPPLTMNQATLSVSGDRIRIFIDASSAAFITYGLSLAKMVVTYEVNREGVN